MIYIETITADIIQLHVDAIVNSAKIGLKVGAGDSSVNQICN